MALVSQLLEFEQPWLLVCKPKQTKLMVCLRQRYVLRVLSIGCIKKIAGDSRQFGWTVMYKTINIKPYIVPERI